MRFSSKEEYAAVLALRRQLVGLEGRKRTRGVTIPKPAVSGALYLKLLNYLSQFLIVFIWLIFMFLSIKKYSMHWGKGHKKLLIKKSNNNKLFLPTKALTCKLTEVLSSTAFWMLSTCFFFFFWPLPPPLASFLELKGPKLILSLARWWKRHCEDHLFSVSPCHTEINIFLIIQLELAWSFSMAYWSCFHQISCWSKVVFL